MPAGGTDALAFYLQQGANIGSMAMRLMALGRPPGTQYLEVGCGFGLSLDFARRILGWQVLGLDPSPFAAEGRTQLNLPIESRFLRADHLDQASADIIHASEFIEHVSNPVEMLATLRQALRPGGTLLLTTPAAEMIRPDTSDGLLLPLLSAGWHLVIHTAGSLEWALRTAGFDEVEVVREGAQLVAVAGPLKRVHADRDRYVEWLRQLAGAAPAGSDLWLGGMARLYRELVIAGSDATEPVWNSIDAVCRFRYRVGLEALAALSDTHLSLASLTAREPLCLAGLLLARAWWCRRAGLPNENLISGAITAAARLRAALREVGADDGDAEDVSFAAQAERILLALDHRDGDIPALLEALRDAGGAKHVERIAPVCFITLVNQSAFEQASILRPIALGTLAAWRSPGPPPLTLLDASVVYCAAALELQLPDGERDEAINWLILLQNRVVASRGIADDLFWPAVDAEMLGYRLLGREVDAEEVCERATQTAREADLPPPPAHLTLHPTS